MPQTQTFGAYLKMLRSRTEITQRDLAKKLGLSPSAVGNWENDSGTLGVENLKKLIGLLVELKAFQEGQEQAEAQKLWAMADKGAVFDDSWFAGLGKPSSKALTVAGAIAPASPPGTQPEFEAYCGRLLQGGDFKYLKITVSDKQLLLEKAYIQLKVVEKELIKYKPEDEYNKLGQISPNDYYKIVQERLSSRGHRAISPVETLKKYPQAVILGDPGAGKSTTLRYLAHRVAGQPANRLPGDLPEIAFPVFISLAKFVNDPETNLENYLARWLEQEYHFKDCHAHLEAQLLAGRVLLLLDGLDEVTVSEKDEATTSYQKVTGEISRMHRRYPTTPILVTCRKAGWKGGLDGFAVLEVLDFQPPDIKRFIEVWFENDSPAKAPRLVGALQKNVRMQLLAANPLLLSLICLTFEEDYELPENRAKLYKKCIDWLLRKWDGKRELDRRNRFSSDKKEVLLEGLALYFQEKRQRYFEEEELLKQIKGILPGIGLDGTDPRNILDEIVENQGLLELEGIGWYGFSHLTLQEYFVATRLAKDHQFERATRHAGDPWWEEVILLMAGEGNAAPLLENLLSGPDDIFYTRLLLACQALSGASRVDPAEWRTIIIEETRRLLLDKSQSLSLRSRAASPLAQLRGVQLNFLLDLLADENLDSDVRQSIALALGTLGNHSIIPALLSLLTARKLDSLVGYSIAFALGTSGERSIIPDLLALLKDQNLDRFVRMGIAQTLGTLGERSIIPDLLALLKDQNLDMFVHMDIVQTLGTLGERSIIPDLLALLKDQKLDSVVRQSIAQALHTLGERSIIPDLLSLLKDENLDSDVRQSIALALGTLGERSIIPDLLALLKDKTLDMFVRQRIAETLGTLGERSIIPDLLALLKDKTLDMFVRQRIAPVLSKLVSDPADLGAMARLSSKNFDITEEIYRAALRLRVRIYRDEKANGRFDYRVEALPE